MRQLALRVSGSPLFRTLAPFLLVIAAAVCVRWLFLYGLVGSDDTWYTDASTALARGHAPERIDHFTVRAAYMSWLALWSLIGLPASQLAITQLLTSVLQAVALFWIARELTDVRSATYAAILWIFFPVELVYGGILVPDQLGLGLALMAVAFALWSLRDVDAPRIGAAIVAGVLTGLAYSVKEPLVVALAAILLWGLIRPAPKRPAWKWFIAVSAGAFFVFLLEHLFFALWTGDWLYKYRALSDSYGSSGSHVYPVSLRRLSYYVVDVLARPGVVGLFGALLFAGALLGLPRIRHRSLVVYWTAAFFIFLQFGTTDPFNYQLLPMQPRYVGPIVVLLFVPLGAAVAYFQRRSLAANIAAIAVLIAIMVHGAFVAHQRLQYGLYYSDFPNSASDALDRRRADPEIRAHQMLVPMGYGRRLPVDLRDSISTWHVGDLRPGSKLIEENVRCVIVLPVHRWSPELREALTAREFRELEITRPVIPMDGLLGRAPSSVLRSISRRRTAGYYYIPPFAARSDPLPNAEDGAQLVEGMSTQCHLD